MADIITSIDNASFTSQKNVKPKQDNKNSFEGGGTFMEALSEGGENLMNTVKNAEKSIGSFTKGNISPDSAIIDVNIGVQELDVGMSVVKTTVESAKQVLNMTV